MIWLSSLSSIKMILTLLIEFIALYISFYSWNLEIRLSASFFITYFICYFEETNLYKALLLFIDLFKYIWQIQILELVFKVEHLLFLVLKLFLIFYLVGSI